MIKYYPGIITNNEGKVYFWILNKNIGLKFDFDCGTGRALTYFLEYLVIFAFFGKSNLSINLKGVTNDNIDPSIDSFVSS